MGILLYVGSVCDVVIVSCLIVLLYLPVCIRYSVMRLLCLLIWILCFCLVIGVLFNAWLEVLGLMFIYLFNCGYWLYTVLHLMVV